MQKMLGLLAAAALSSVSQHVLALSVSSGPIPPKPGPALAERLALHDCEVYGIVHWGLNTYTDREWGYGNEDPARLNPAKFDAEQIVGACKAGGLGGLIVVAKHHDGFCLWPTKTTEYNISKSPFRGGKGDYVREMAQACRKARLKFGVYISPWDRHDADYATPTYVEKYHAQIKELLSGDYGKIFEIWFDGANGGDGWYGGANERRTIGGDYYRFPEVFKFVRELQPMVCIFAGESDASDFRWPGNERGVLDPDSGATICSTGGFAGGKFGNPEYMPHINTGMRAAENSSSKSFFRVCECDFPMRPGWFYHEKDRGRTKSAAYLMQRYLNTVGNGGTMNIGIAPNKDGRLDAEDVKALKGFKELKDAFFAKQVYGSARANVVVLWENVNKHGELAPGWKLVRRAQAGASASGEVPLASGKVIGVKRIRILPESVPEDEIKLARPTEADFAEPPPQDYSILARHYYTDPELIQLIMSATTESGETDTAKWMTAGKQGAAPKELTVAPDGMSPKDALVAIRSAKEKGDSNPWTVHVKPGVYVLKEPLVFTPADSGTPEAPVRWVGDGGEAVFSGGEPLADWCDKGNGVWSAPIPKTPSGERACFEQLWVNGRRADRARFPNSDSSNPIAGYLRITSASITPVADAAGKTNYVEHVVPSGAVAMVSTPADELQWAQMCVVHKWAFSRRVIKSIDSVTGAVETHSPKNWQGWRNWTPRETIVWFENVRGGFDAPGEWFYDGKNGCILYRPLPGEKIESVVAFAPNSKLSRLLEIKGDPDKNEFVHDIQFEGLVFAVTDGWGEGREDNRPTQSYQHQAAFSNDGAITATGAHRLAWDRCVFRHTGNYAMQFLDGCVSNTVTRCLMEDLGAGGMIIGSRCGYVANGETLSRRVISKRAPRTVAFNRVENCVIRGGGRFNPEATGIVFTHVSDSKVLHCDIYDFFYSGVSVGWTWGFRGSVAQRNEIAYNRIYDLGKGVMSDMGGVYTLGTSFGTTVHDNVIHDVNSYSYGGWGIYFDEGSEGVVAERNLCWNTTDGGFHQHYGTGCIVRNNIFAWNRTRGAVRMERAVVQDVPCTLNFLNNIVIVKGSPLAGRGVRNVGGIWAGNLWYDFSGKPDFDGLDWNGWVESGKEILGKYADPQFENPEAFDFRLKPSSPAFALGFKPWDSSKAGASGRQ